MCALLTAQTLVAFGVEPFDSVRHYFFVNLVSSCSSLLL